MPPILMWVLVVVAAAVCGALGYYFGGENRKRTAEEDCTPIGTKSLCRLAWDGFSAINGRSPMSC